MNARFWAALVLIAGISAGWFSVQQGVLPYRLGLDLAGGTQLVYRADVSDIPPEDVSGAMTALRGVIERRVNVLGVSEPRVQVAQSSAVAGAHEERLIVELPGVTNIDEAIAHIGKTPTLEFKLLQFIEQGTSTVPTFLDTGLTGRYLNSARVAFQSGEHSGNVGSIPVVSLTFNSEGRELFAAITRDNIGEVLGIFLDGALISDPVIQSEITTGDPIITGGFTPQEARVLARNLNFGALPVPIELVSTVSVGATLGHEAVGAGITAGLIGLGVVALFLLVWYRREGVVAVLALGLYGALMLSLFRVVPVTLTAAGLAGFILSIGMAVDANILIFERIKEERADGKEPPEALKEGFSRAWTSIRDANLSSLLTALVLFWFGTSLVQGFALTFGIGVLMSMLTAVTVSRIFLRALLSNQTT